MYVYADRIFLIKKTQRVRHSFHSLFFVRVFLVLNPEISGTHCTLTSPHAMHFTLTLGADDDQQNYSVAFVFLFVFFFLGGGGANEKLNN